MRFPFALQTIALAALCAGLHAQTANTAQPPKPAPAKAELPKVKVIPEEAPPPPSAADEPAYIRRVIVGGTMSFFPLSHMLAGSTDETYTTPAAQVKSTSTNKGAYFGAGLTVQAFVTERWAVAAGLLYRRPAYNLTTNFYSGTDLTTTSYDDRAITDTVQSVRATYWDVPLLVRRYNKGRYEGGWRYFYQAGPTMRKVRNIRTSTQVTDPDGEVDCCSEVPVSPAKNQIFGATVGAGITVVDDFHLKITPEFRYTRWFGGIFNTRAAQSRRHQIEILFTLSF